MKLVSVLLAFVCTATQFPENRTMISYAYTHWKLETKFCKYNIKVRNSSSFVAIAWSQASTYRYVTSYYAIYINNIVVQCLKPTLAHRAFEQNVLALQFKENPQKNRRFILRLPKKEQTKASGNKINKQTYKHYTPNAYLSVVEWWDHELHFT